MPNENNQHSLNKSSIYKLVNRRLSIVLFFVVVSIGISSYYLEQHRLHKNIQNIAIKRAGQYVLQFGEELTNPQAVDNGTVKKHRKQKVKIPYTVN